MSQQPGVSILWTALPLAGLLTAAAMLFAEPEARASDAGSTNLDHQLQGEYFGAPNGSRSTGNWGLQIVALGDGRFEGRLLPGGLPGAGWIRSQSIRLSGERQADQLRLFGEGIAGQKFDVEIGQELARFRAPHQMEPLRKIYRVGPTLGLPAPRGAWVLFADSAAQKLEHANLSADGYLAVGAKTTFPVVDFHMHLEFRTPFMPAARGQGRGNSGIYIQERYEIQILDSFGLAAANNDCGALYKQAPPDVNMCLPPQQWQTYDIDFRAARFDAQGTKAANARITVLHNGEPIHWNREISTKTGAGQVETPDPRAILFQDHGNPVEFNNVWMTAWTTNLDLDDWSTPNDAMIRVRALHPRRSITDWCRRR